MRPLGHTLMALTLGALSIAGLVGTVVTSDPLWLRALSGVYGIVAIVSAIGIWQRRTWAASAFAIWSLTVLLGVAAFDLTGNAGPTLRGVLFLTLAACLLWFAHRYLRKRAISA